MKAHILQWKNGKTAPLSLAFDDNMPTHLEHAIPLLEAAGIAGTFYINPGQERFEPIRAAWTEAAQSPNVILANHTYTHIGATSVAQMEDELERCSQSIQALTPNQKWPRMLSFGRPGGVPWEFTDEQTDQILSRFHLVRRPAFRNPYQEGQTLNETTALLSAMVDEALQSDQPSQIAFHGIGDEWLPTPLDSFHALIEKLATHHVTLWFTDPASWHKYQTERDNSTLEVSAQSDTAITLQLTCITNAQFYDEPLSLAVEVPPSWRHCQVTQGSTAKNIAIEEGQVHFEASPVSGEIRLERL